MIEENFNNSFIFSLILGCFLHFTYNIFGNFKWIGYFSAVNESIWEHTKLATFPILFYSLYVFMKNNGNLNNYFTALPIALIISTITVPVVFYSYYKLINTPIFIFDIGIFCLACYLGCKILWYIVSLSSLPRVLGAIGLVLTFTIVGCFIKWTYNPPNHPMFTRIGH